MPTEPPHRHNGGPLSDDDARKLWDHVRALEVLNEQQDEIRLDMKMRKELAKADGFDNNILASIIRRRKLCEGETRAADSMIKLYEEALREQGVLPLEESRAPTPAPRRTVEEIAQDLHGQDAPPMPEKLDSATREAAERLKQMAAENGLTISVGVGNASNIFD